MHLLQSNVGESTQQKIGGAKKTTSDMYSSSEQVMKHVASLRLYKCETNFSVGMQYVRCAPFFPGHHTFLSCESFSVGNIHYAGIFAVHLFTSQLEVHLVSQAFWFPWSVIKTEETFIQPNRKYVLMGCMCANMLANVRERSTKKAKGNAI